MTEVKNTQLVATRSLPIRKSSLFKPVVAVFMLCAVGNAFAELIWSDEFDSGTALNEQYWSYDLGAGGWGNNELQRYTNAPENVRIENGNLVITAIETEVNDTRGFTSARVKTEAKVTITYGTIEARVKIPDLANGLWPAIWMLGSNFDVVGWPSSGEIDILEMGHSTAISDGVVNRRIGSAAHWQDNGGHVTYAGSLTSPTGLNDDFHVIRMEWTPTAITTFLDDEQIWVMDISEQACGDCDEFHKPFFLILNLAVGGSYPGITEPDQITATLPAEMLIDYIRVYDNDHTIMGGTGIEADNPWYMMEYSGSWYNGDQSGHGFSIEFGRSLKGNPRAVVYWYIYDASGNPMFMVGAGRPEGNTLTIDFASPYGMVYGVFDKDSVSRPEGGTGVFMFSDANNGTFSYTPSEFSVNTWGHSTITDLPIVKLFGIPVSTLQE
jgi:beta-glucanase (GH16 family)